MTTKPIEFRGDWKVDTLCTATTCVAGAALSAVIGKIVFGSVDFRAVGVALGILSVYGLVGVWFNRRAMGGDIFTCILWGLVGKFVRSFVLAIVIVFMVWAEVTARVPFLLTILIGWCSCAICDVYLLYRRQPAPDSDHSLPEPTPIQ